MVARQFGCSELSPVYVDKYLCDRKTYVEGARASEIFFELPTSKLLDSKKATLHTFTNRKKRSIIYRRLNYCAVPDYAPICMDANDPLTVECAFIKRLMRDIPDFVPNKLMKVKIFVQDWLVKNVSPLPVTNFQSLKSFEEWLKSCGDYNEKRKEQLRKCYHELFGFPPDKRQSSKIDSFVKRESYMTYKHARMINSRSDYFKVFAGPRIHAIENVIYQNDWLRPNGIGFIKHIPEDQRPSRIKQMRSRGKYVIGTDFTAFESHFTPEIMDVFECALYRHCLKFDAHCDFLCNVLTGVNRMHTRTGISAKVTARRMSGDMNTSLGNGFTNLMLALYLAEHFSIVGFVEGDDGLFVTDKDLTETDYLELGFTIKIEHYTDPCEASFCGIIFSESGETIRDPYKFMSKFGWTLSFIHAGKLIMDELLRAKALSSVYETPQCPIVGAFARYALYKTRHVHPRYVSDYHHMIPPDEMPIPKFAPTLQTRLLFARIFHINIDTQIIVEQLALYGNFAQISIILRCPSDDMVRFSSRYIITR